MLVEERDRDKEVVCLLCKTPFRIGGPAARAEKVNEESAKSGNE